jgi:hypothetical protein
MALVFFLQEQRLLDRISRAYHLPDWCSIDDYSRIATADLGMSGRARAVILKNQHTKGPPLV